MIKRQFGHLKVSYRGLAKSTAKLHTLFRAKHFRQAENMSDSVESIPLLPQCALN